MPSVATSAGRRVVVGAVASAILLSGCATTHNGGRAAIAGPAAPAVAPAPSTPPAGEIRTLARRPRAAVVDPASSALVVLGATDADGRETLTVLGPGPSAPRTIGVPAPVTELAGDGHGHALLATRGGYFTVELATGTVAKTDVSGQQGTDFTAIARRSDGRMVLGSAEGSVFTLASPTDVAHREKMVTRVDSIVTQGNTAVVLDRGQTSVTAVDSDGNAQQALRAGEGATTMTADPAGRVLVVDTRGDELLVFGVDPLILRQRYPVHESPYGVAGSAGLAWVSQTATNVVIGYDLSTGIPVEKVRYPTVQQPNILAYDDASGALYVVSGSGAGVQVIEHAAEPR